MASIFELGDQFGLTNSPLGDWLPQVASPPLLMVRMQSVATGDSHYTITCKIVASGFEHQVATLTLWSVAQLESLIGLGISIGMYQNYMSSATKSLALASASFTDKLDVANTVVRPPLGPLPSPPQVFQLLLSSNGFTALSQEFTLSPTGDPCSRDLTFDELCKLAPKASAANVQKHLEGFNKACSDNGINTPLRKAHFLAQLLTESANLKATCEYGSKEKLEKKYHGFEGRGLIQLTGRANYTAYGKAVGEDFVKDLAARTKLENSPHAARSAGWFWARNGLSVWADTNDFIALTRRINGAYNGYSSRLASLNTILRALAAMGHGASISTDYRLEDSAVYGSARDTFAWGLWHDPGLERNNLQDKKHHPIPPEAPRDTAQALIGYRRAVELLEQNEKQAKKNVNLFKINKMEEFATVRTTVRGKVRVTALDAAKLRIQELTKKP